MACAKRGDKVSFHYTGRLADGRIFDSTENAGTTAWDDFRGEGVSFGPPQLVIGAGEMPPDFEAALIGLEPGEQVTVTIPTERAFGPRDEERVTVVPLDDFAPRELGLDRFRVAEGRHRPNKFDPKVGDVWDVTGHDGAQVRMRITSKDDETVTLDANHPLAGCELAFDIRLVEILSSSADA
jgi:peptidylprolyl isomerase